MAKKGAIAAAVVGIGALGLGAVALMRSGDTTQKKNADSMFSGMLGGGATGGYSDSTGVITPPSTGVITPPSNTVTPPSSSITDTIGGILSDVIQTPPQTQTPIIITPPNSGADDLLPLINAIDNPSDEVSDVKQVATPELMGNVFQNYSGYELVSALDSIGFTTTPTVSGQSNAASALMQSISQTANTQSGTAVEYSPFNFAPTPKQQDISSYNVGKAGGATANTPAKNTNTGGSSVNRPAENTATGGNKVEYVTQKAVDLYSGIASSIGGFFGGLFGGK